MSDYRRWYVPGGTFFFTLVVHERRPILTADIARTLLHDAIDKEKQKRPFTIVAMVLLPDHLHAVWTLPPRDHDYSLRWQKIKIKEQFTRLYLATGGAEGLRNRSRRRKREF